MYIGNHWPNSTYFFVLYGEEDSDPTKERFDYSSGTVPLGAKNGIGSTYAV